MQVIDSQIDAQRTRLTEIDHFLAHHPELDAARSEEAAAGQLQEQSRMHALQSEEENRHQLQKIQDTEKTLYGGGVRNPKELQDLQLEIASLHKYQTTLEERQLLAMVALEEIDDIHARAQRAVAEQEKNRSEQEEVWRTEQADIRTQLDKMEMQAEAILAAIPPEDLTLYNTLRKSKHGRAVVKMESDSCPGCGVTPSTSRLDAARSGQDIVQCGNCGRILYMG
jgi:uncharacterized protein